MVESGVVDSGVVESGRVVASRLSASSIGVVLPAASVSRCHCGTGGGCGRIDLAFCKIQKNSVVDQKAVEN